MEQTMIAKDTQTPIELINQTFSASESIDALNELIEKRINRLKVEHWQAWEKDHTICRDEIDRKIAELQIQKEHLNALIEDASGSDIRLKLSGSIEIAS